MINKKRNYRKTLFLAMFFGLGSFLSAHSIDVEKNNSFEQQQTNKNYTIKGTVLDNNNDPIIGASIKIADTSVGTATDIDGNFTLKVPEGSKFIEFSFIGFKTQVIKFNPSHLNAFRVVIMIEDAVALDDVTVVAFAKQKKESVLGSVTSIKPAELRTTSSNLTTGFAGKLAGVIAYQRSGEPGQDNADFFVRGVTTFGTGRANPLILIDNVELTTADLSRLNTDDIASFSVLKDATATALYGARGANGVILVTTKEGDEGKMRLSVRVENSLSAPSKDVAVADPITYMTLHNEATRTRNPLATLPYLESDIAARTEGRNPYAFPMVDWKDMLFKDYTNNQRGNLSINGGGRVARYYVALTYARDTGIMKTINSNSFDNNISLNKYGVRTNVNINLTKTTELAVRISGTFDSYQGPLSGGANMYKNALNSSTVLFPASFLPDEATKFNNHILFGNFGDKGQYFNPYADMCRGYKESENTAIVAQLELKQDLSFITKGLKGRILGNSTRNSSYDLTRDYKPFYYTLGHYDKLEDTYTLTALNPENGTDYLGYSQGGKTINSTIYMETSLSYDRVFADVHSVSGMLVYTVREAKSANESSLQLSLPKRNMGLAGRFTYGLSDRYYAEFNFGYNGSERFDKDHRWGFFPSGGFGWIVSKENFWANKPISKVISMMKLKGTYGLVGNDNIAEERFFYLSEVAMDDGGKGMNFGTDFNKGHNGISVKRYANKKIGWEIAHKLNLGVELKLFDKAELQIDYFRERRTNILQERADIPSLMGFQQKIRANIGEAKSHGFDMSLDYSEYINKDLWATVRGTFTYATGKYSKFEEPDYSATPWRSLVGTKLSQPRGLIAERLFVDKADVDNSPRQQFGEYMAGDIKYKDINQDGLIDARDVVPIGLPTTPEVIYGFGLSVGYKSFDFSCFFQGSGRSSFFINPADISPFAATTPGDKKGNRALLQTIVDNHWSEDSPNPYAFWPRLSPNGIGNNNQSSTWWLRDGTFLRLKSVELGYNVPDKLLSKIRLANLRVYLTGTNLFNITNFKLWDTEMGGSGLGYPVQRVFNIGLQISL